MQSILSEVVSQVETREFEQACALVLNQPTFVGKLALIVELVNRFRALLGNSPDFGTIFSLCAEIEQSLSHASDASRGWGIVLEIDLALMHFHTLEHNVTYKKDVASSAKELLKVAKAALTQIKTNLSG